MFGRRTRPQQMRRSRTRALLRALPLLTVTALVAALLTVVTVTTYRASDDELVTAKPAQVEKHELEVVPEPERPVYTPDDAAEVDVVDQTTPPISNGTVVAELSPHDLPEFELLGVTWTGGVPIDVTEIQVRWKQDGAWSPWTILGAEENEVEGGIPGTEPKWVGPSEAAQARIVSSESIDPEGLTLVTVDGGETPTLTPAAQVLGQPPIVMRSQWGARPYGGPGCGTAPANGTFSGTIVHHTAGSNTYTAAQSAGIVKSTQAYHMNGQKWCDIGYNFLIDKYGQIFEGRAGGVTATPYGAHAGNTQVNANTTGVSLMGEFTSVQPTQAMKDAAVRLTAWRHAMFGVSPTGAYSIGGVRIQRIDGHRSVKATACPGQQVFNWLPTMRTEVAAMIASYDPPPTPAPPTGFADVPASHTFADAITWLSESGISTGYVQNGTTTFRGSQPVLREQMAAFVYRFQGEPAFTAPTTSPFRDLARNHTFFTEITWLASTGVTTGYGSGANRTYRGSEPVLREQMAAFLFRVATIRSGGQEPAVTLPSTSPFTDVPRNHTFYKEIVWMAQQGISEGYRNANGSYSFRGKDPVLREQMAAFLHRLHGVTNFSDVPSSHVFRDAIQWLALSGIAPGNRDGSASVFDVQARMKRSEMAAYLYRLQGKPAYSAPTASPFTDVSTGHALYREISWLASTGITTGYVGPGGTSFVPDEPVLREQVAAFLFRLATIRNGGKEPAVTLPSTSPFTDVPRNHTFYKEIVWMAQKGISEGYGNSNGTSSFRGQDPVLREQMAAFLSRFQALPRG